MALSESGLLAAGVMPGPMIYGPKGHQITVRPKSGSAPNSKRTVNFYVKPVKSRGKGTRGR